MFVLDNIPIISIEFTNVVHLIVKACHLVMKRLFAIKSTEELTIQGFRNVEIKKKQEGHDGPVTLT